MNLNAVLREYMYSLCSPLQVLFSFSFENSQPFFRSYCRS